MIIEDIKVSYFLGFGKEQRIHFDGSKVIGIMGTYDVSPLQSNRAGKSSFLEIILYNLFGKCRAKKSSDTINWNYPDEDMITEVRYNFSGKIITIKRGRTTSNNPILEVTGCEDEHKRDIQEIIDEYVGCGYNDFILLNYFMQDDFNSFMNSGANKMTENLSRWIDISYWDRCKSNADNKMKIILNDIEDCEAYIKHNNIPLESIRMASESKKELETTISLLKDKLKLKKDSEAIQQMYEDLAEEKQKLESDNKSRIDSKIEKLNIRLQKKAKAQKQITANKKQYKILKSKIDNNVSKTDLKELNKKLVSLQTDTRVLKSKIKQIESRKEKVTKGKIVCPVTESECKFIKGTKQQEFINQYNLEIEELDNQLINTGREHTIISKQYSKIEKILDSNSEIESELNDLEIDDSDIKEEIIEIQEDIKELEEKKLENAKRIKVIDKKLQKFDSEIELVDQNEIRKLEDEIKESTIQLGEYIKTIKDGNTKRRECKAKKQELSELYKDYRKYKFISYMFSKKGIQSHQIEEAYSEVEADANYILKSKFNSDIQIEFKPYKELNQKEDICPVCGFKYPKGYRKNECEECGAIRGKKRKDEPQLKIYVGDKESDFQLDSGGGKTIISLAVRIALIRMLGRRTGIKCPILFLDEIFAPMDEVNRKHTVNMILDTLTEEFGFDQIFCISHQKDVSDTIRNNIVITKYDKYSTIEWGV